MVDFWAWITDLGNSKIVALLLFMGTFVAIVGYLFSNGRRSARFESYRYIPLDDDESPLDPHAHARERTKSEKK